MSPHSKPESTLVLAEAEREDVARAAGYAVGGYLATHDLYPAVERIIAARLAPTVALSMETVAEVLAAHQYRDVQVDYEVAPFRKHFGCSCGWKQDIGGMSGWRSWVAAHADHLAAAVVAAEPRRTEAEVKAEGGVAELGWVLRQVSTGAWSRTGQADVIEQILFRIGQIKRAEGGEG